MIFLFAISTQEVASMTEVDRPGITGELLHRFCKSENVEERNNAVFFLMGTYNSVVFLKSWEKLPADYICIEESISSDQIRQMFVTFGDKNPDHLNQPATAILLKIMEASFPCK